MCGWSPLSDHFGNLRTCNVRRLPGWADLRTSVDWISVTWIFWIMSAKTVFDAPSVWVPIYPDFSSTFITKGVQKLYQLFPSCNWKPKLVLRSKGLKIRPNIWKESDVCQNNLINAWLSGKLSNTSCQLSAAIHNQHYRIQTGKKKKLPTIRRYLYGCTAH